MRFCPIKDSCQYRKKSVQIYLYLSSDPHACLSCHMVMANLLPTLVAVYGCTSTVSVHVYEQHIMTVCHAYTWLLLTVSCQF